jgi:outer membrane protein assembly factor BamB
VVGKVILLGDEKYFYALNINTRRIKWKIKVNGTASSAAIKNGIAYFSVDSEFRIEPNKLYLYSVNIKNGKIRWKLKINKSSGFFPSTPVIDNESVYLTSEGEGLYVVDIHTGHKKWQFKVDGILSSATAIFKEVAYFAANGTLYAVNTKTGKEKWHFETSGGESSNPSIADGIVYFVSSSKEDETLTFDDYLYAIEAETGKIKWKYEQKKAHNYGGSSGQSLFVLDGVIYYSSHDRFLVALY